MDRRAFLRTGAATAASLSVVGASQSLFDFSFASAAREYFHVAPTRSVIPVVGDGKWVWTKPPANETGYLEPRSYELKVGIAITGRGNATAIKATTPVPLPLPEQQI